MDRVIKECFELHTQQHHPNIFLHNGQEIPDAALEMDKKIVFGVAKDDLVLQKLAFLGMLTSCYAVRELIRPCCDPDYFPNFLRVLDNILCSYVMTDSGMKDVSFSSAGRLLQLIQEYFSCGMIQP
jgi:hypothetical protein